MKMRNILVTLCLIFLTAAARGDSLVDFWKAPSALELPFDEEWIVQKEENGLTWKEFYFTSEVVGGTPFRVYAIYAAPKGTAKSPGVLYIHGGGGTADPEMVRSWAKLGYSCLSFDWSANPKDKKFNRPQFSKFGEYTEVDYGPANFAQTLGQCRPHQIQVAARRAITWMQQQVEVNSEKIGVLGISWGGFSSLILNGIDDRVKAVVDIYGAGYYQEFGTNGGCFGLTGPLKFEPVEKQAEWLSRYDPQHYVTTAHAPVLMFTGTNDMFFWLPLVLKTYDALPVEKRLRLDPNINHRLTTESILAEAKPWFDYYLRESGSQFPNVQMADISEDKCSIKVSAGQRSVKSAQLHVLWHMTKKEKVPISAYVQKEVTWQSTEVTQNGVNDTWQGILPKAPVGAASAAIYATVEMTDGVKVSCPMTLIELSPVATSAL